MKNPNFLILDEPTNDLDLLTLNKLEEFLMDFQGCLIVVSHDRYFMDKLTNHLFVFEGDGQIKDEYCSYSEFRQKQLAKQKIEKAMLSKENSTTKESKKEVKISYKDKYEYEQLSKEIEALEEEKKQLEAELMNQTLSFEELQEVSKNMEILITSLENKTDRWIELDELM